MWWFFFPEYFKKDGEKCFLNKTASMEKCINPHAIEYEKSIRGNTLAVRFNKNMCKYVFDDYRAHQGWAQIHYRGPSFRTLNICGPQHRKQKIKNKEVALYYISSLPSTPVRSGQRLSPSDRIFLVHPRPNLSLFDFERWTGRTKNGKWIECGPRAVSVVNP